MRFFLHCWGVEVDAALILNRLGSAPLAGFLSKRKGGDTLNLTFESCGVLRLRRHGGGAGWAWSTMPVTR